MINATTRVKASKAIVIASNYYKVIVIHVDVFESTIIDERHFKSIDVATSFMESNTSDSTTCLLLAM